MRVSVKACIGVLERGVNPTTGKPVPPTIQTLDKIAGGTKRNIDSLLNALMVPTCNYYNNSRHLSDEQAPVLKVYDELPSDGRRDFWNYLEFLQQ